MMDDAPEYSVECISNDPRGPYLIKRGEAVLAMVLRRDHGARELAERIVEMLNWEGE